MKTIAAIVLCFLALSACEDNSLFDTHPQEFYPLSIGNSWKYAMTPSLLRNADSTVIESVSTDTTVNGEKWFFLSSPSGQRTRGSHYRNRQDGTWVLSLFPHVDARLLYKYPATMNESYLALNSIDTIKIVGLADRTDVPAGIFTCVVYQRKFWVLALDSTIQAYYTNVHVAPGVGKVKEEMFTYNQSSQKKVSAQYLLLEYSLR
jgi:hypothetical protein